MTVKPIVLHPAQFEAFKKSGWIEVGPDGKPRFNAKNPTFPPLTPIHVVR